MNKKVSIVIIIILLVISGVFLGYYYINQDTNIEENPGTGDDNDNDNPTDPVEIDYDMLIIDNVSNWGYANGRWHRLSKEEIENFVNQKLNTKNENEEDLSISEESLI